MKSNGCTSCKLQIPVSSASIQTRVLIILICSYCNIKSCPNKKKIQSSSHYCVPSLKKIPVLFVPVKWNDSVCLSTSLSRNTWLVGRLSLNTSSNAETQRPQITAQDRGRGAPLVSFWVVQEFLPPETADCWEVGVTPCKSNFTDWYEVRKHSWDYLRHPGDGITQIWIMLSYGECWLGNFPETENCYSTFVL